MFHPNTRSSGPWVYLIGQQQVASPPRSVMVVTLTNIGLEYFISLHLLSLLMSYLYYSPAKAMH